MRFYGILLKVKRQSFNPLKICDLAFCQSTGWSTEAEVGRPVRSTDVYTCTGRLGWKAGQPTRSTARDLCSLELAPVDRAADR